MAEEKRTVENIIEEQIKFSDMTKKDLAVLPKMLTLIYKRKSKSSGRMYYGFIIKFHDKLKITKTLEENEYNVICLDFPEESEQGDEFVITIPYIPTTGKYTDEESYHMVQLGIGKTLYKQFFLTPIENRLLIDFKANKNFIFRAKKIDKNEFN